MAQRRSHHGVAMASLLSALELIELGAMPWGRITQDTLSPQAPRRPCGRAVHRRITRSRVSEALRAGHARSQVGEPLGRATRPCLPAFASRLTAALARGSVQTSTAILPRRDSVRPAPRGVRRAAKYSTSRWFTRTCAGTGRSPDGQPLPAALHSPHPLGVGCRQLQAWNALSILHPKCLIRNQIQLARGLGSPTSRSEH
jgi:hypothetical protein